MPTYLGIDVYDTPQESRGRTDEITRRFPILGDSNRYADSYEAAPRLVRRKRIHLVGEAEVAAFRVFLDARKGQAVPFWMPGYTHDLVLAVDAASFLAYIDVYNVGYTTRMFPPGGGRRHLMIRNVVNNQVVYRRIISSVDNGATERITFDQNVGINGSSLLIVTFLRYCRLADDSARIVWVSRGYAYCDLRVTEIPNEAPT